MVLATSTRIRAGVSDANVAIVQLPFPSQQDPNSALSTYYLLYEQAYRDIFPHYETQSGDIWEAPLWVAHLDGAIGRFDTVLIDLSKTAPDADVLAGELERQSSAATILFFSPLAQNFTLAASVSRRLMSLGSRTVVGGNMADLARPEDFTVIYLGLARRGIYEEVTAGATGRIGQVPAIGTRQSPFGYRPRYRLIANYSGRIPLLRINASHGCLFGCTFCGDAWTRQLHVVPLDDLREEFAELSRAFPDVRLIYIGDKTFGQSWQAVENLIRAVPTAPPYEFIVQTHVELISERLVDCMLRLNVKVVEMGFETADSAVLRKMKKIGGAERYVPALERLRANGMHVVLNVLGGLPYETKQTARSTLSFLRETEDLAPLHKLYNFVPYPKTPLFPTIRDRIFDWNFENWREDRPIVYQPYLQTPGQAWDQFLELVATCSEICARKLRHRHNGQSRAGQ